MKRVNSIEVDTEVSTNAWTKILKYGTSFLITLILISSTQVVSRAESVEEEAVNETLVESNNPLLEGGSYSKENVDAYLAKKQKELKKDQELRENKSNPYVKGGTYNQDYVDSYMEEQGQRLLVQTQIANNGGYIVDVDKLVEEFETESLSKLSDSDNLYNYHSKEEIETELEVVRQNFEPNEVAVNSTLALIDFAAQEGKKLDYDWGGGHTDGPATLNHVAEGVDCSGLVSWAIDQGTKKDFPCLSTDELLYIGESESKQDAKTGDIIVYNWGDQGHTCLVVKNDPDNSRMLVAEASCSEIGVILDYRSYDDISYYDTRDLSSLYSKGRSK